MVLKTQTVEETATVREQENTVSLPPYAEEALTLLRRIERMTDIRR